MIRESTNRELIFGDKIHLNNTANAQTDDGMIAAEGYNVAIAW